MKLIRRPWSWQIILLASLVAISCGQLRVPRAFSSSSTPPWGEAAAIAGGLAQAAQPSLAYTSDGTLHAAWVADGRIYHASRPPRGSWSAAQRIANGSSPSLAVDARGKLHLLFGNRIFGNYEVYHAAWLDPVWTPPVNISHTEGVSSSPQLFAGKDALLHAVWMDNTSGRWGIYIATYNGRYWTNYPVPNGRGESPAGAVAPDGTLFVAWQVRVPSRDNPAGSYDIVLAQHTGSGWTLPANISDLQTVNSIGVSITADSEGLAQLAWIESGKKVRYAYGRGIAWAPPVTVAGAPSLARGPRIVIERGVLLHIGWDEGQMVRLATATLGEARWSAPQLVAAGLADLGDLALVWNPRGGLTAGWIQATKPGELGFYTSSRASSFTNRVWLPIAKHK